MTNLAPILWNQETNRFNRLLEKLSDAQLQQEIAPGKNTGVYLIGHILTANDSIFPLFGFGAKLYPELENIFMRNPDQSGLEKPAISTLRQMWKTQSEALASRFQAMTEQDWLSKHSAISDEDFQKEPHRNKLNVLINRINHQAYHTGQLILLV